MKKTKLNALLLGLCLLIGSISSGQARLIEKVDAAPGEAKVSYHKYELANGLIVYLHEDHSDPLVHVEMTYKVGSNREHIGITGFAHFFEHMMFQGSKHVADEQHIQIIEGAGGSMNGTTNTDRTNYFETVPSNMLETALWLESDRMGWLLPAVTKEKFEIQRDAVKNEKDQNIVNQPYVLPFVELYREDFYPEGHPYRWPVIGYVDDLDRVGVEDLRNFFLRWYGPNNAILVVAGDLDPAATIAMIEKYFGPIPRGQEVKPLKIEPHVIHQDVFRQYADNVFAPVVTMYYPSVPNYHRDEAPLDILSDILGGDRNSLMYQRFVKSKFALDASVSNPCSELAGEFQFQIVPNIRQFYDMTPGAMQTMVFDSIRALIKDFDVMRDVKDEDLVRIKAKMESMFINRLESVAGKAGMLTGWEHLAGGKSFNLPDEIARYQKVTKADLKRVFEKYIKMRSALITIVFRAPSEDARTPSVNPNAGKVDTEAAKQYEGLTYTEPVSDFDRSKQPVAPAAKPVKVPEYTTDQMENGIRIIHTQSDELPKVTMVFSISGGQLFEAYNPKLLGLASLTGSMMNEGTQLRSSEKISAELETLGSRISFSGGARSSTVVVTSLTKNIDATLAILEEMLFKPAFAEEDFKRLKDQTEDALINADKQPGVLGSKAFSQLLYGNSILAAFSAGYGKTISSIGLDDVKSYYEKYYAPNLTNLTIVANLPYSELKPKLEFLNKWTKKDVKLPEMGAFPARENTVIYLVDKPGATQSLVLFGTRTMPYDYNGDYYKLMVANYVLGGSFNSRINLNLREEKGYTYGAYSFNTGGQYEGYWAIQSSVKGEETGPAVGEMYKELRKYYESGITPEELELTRKSLNESDALKYETSFDKAGFLSQILTFNLPKNYGSEQNALLSKLTVEDLNAVIKKYLNPDQMIIVIVGDAGDIKPGLQALNIGKITSIDPNKVKIKAVK